MTRIEQELALYRRAINEIDDLIEYRTMDRAKTYQVIDRLAADLAKLYGTDRYELTDAGRAALEGGNGR